MTLQQLEYILALDQTRHFVRAAEKCGVTQPTLSAMIQKLEDELDCKIFDRSQHPLVPTEVGRKIIQQAQVVLYNVNQLKEGIQSVKDSKTGSLSLAMIPTVAPYLLPDFISNFRIDYPEINLKVSEMQTEIVLEKLHSAEIDMAILSTPLNDPKILEVPLYYEKFIAYVSPLESIYNVNQMISHDLPLDNLWMLEEGHCLRSQVFNFCDTKKEMSSMYEAGSIDTLIKIVDRNGGYTVIPELHLQLLNLSQQNNVRELVDPEVNREISLIIRHDYVKEGMMNAVADTVKKIIPMHMLDARLKKFAIRL